MTRTTTDPDHWRFSFTITDLARFLGKSPVTLRGWERKGMISLPRDSGDNRKLSTGDIRGVTNIARDAGRISIRRQRMVESTMLMIELIEQENSKD